MLKVESRIPINKIVSFFFYQDTVPKLIYQFPKLEEKLAEAITYKTSTL